MLYYSYATIIFPVLTLLGLAAFFLYYRKVSLPLSGTTEWISRIINQPRFTFKMTRYPLEREDRLPLIIITLIFTFLALWGLGDFSAPQSFYRFAQQSDEALIELEVHAEIGSLMYYTGLETGNYTLSMSADGVTWMEQKPGKDADYSMDQPHSHLFKWRYANINADNGEVKYIRITASKSGMELGEIALYDVNGNPLTSDAMSGKYAKELFDEQELVPDSPSYMNSMYFDEIYHGRTAYEHLRGIYPYETSHPPLGKEIIGIGITIFQMTPFGWRFIGALCGVLMIVVFYVFLKNVFGRTSVSTCGALLLGFDFMRFVQTRIATIDTYGVLFILLSYFFMYRFISQGMRASFKSRMRPLFLSGLFFGIGCASKWIVVYAGFGLAAIYAIHLIMMGRYYAEHDMPGFRTLLAKTLGLSAVYFVVIPAVIYILSYIPYGTAKDMSIGNGMLWNGDFYKIIIENQKTMYNYHSALVAEHSYSSPWWKWILDARPILYYREVSGNLKSAFAAFGNPIVWWGGFVAMVCMGVRAVVRRDGKALFILIGYLSQLLPWLFISRVVFVYHYFPSTLFLILAIAHVFDTMIERRQPGHRRAVYGLTAAAGALFVMFYPALTGLAVPQGYMRYFLHWLPEWPF